MINIILLLLTCFIQPVANGTASYYTVKSSGTITASGERMDDNKLTCAMKEGKLGSYVLVVLKDDPTKFVTCRQNDRGPYIKGRIIDLSQKAIRKLHPTEGLLQVRVYRLW